MAANLGVLRYLGQGADPASVSIVRPGSGTDMWRLGAHPDIVEHLWTRLNAALPVDARFLVADTAALVHPGSGVVLAVTLGTQYALRLAGAALGQALEAGYATSHEFSTVGRTLDLAATFGEGWVFGQRDEREGGWLAASAATEFRRGAQGTNL